MSVTRLLRLHFTPGAAKSKQIVVMNLDPVASLNELVFQNFDYFV
jgi:hypothetical protein